MYENMPEQILEKKSVQEDFLGSEKYTALKKEVSDSMASVDVLETGESDRDIAPVFGYFEKEAVKWGLSEFQAEKLFWQTVFEEIKETRIQDIYYTIRPDIENKNYAAARRVMTEELSKIIEQLSHTVFSNLSRKSVALTVLKEKFYGLFPEIEALIEETEEEKRAKIKVPPSPPDPEGEFREGLRDPYLVEELKWLVPKTNELVPGLVVTFSDQGTQRIETIEFLEYPHFEDGDLFVKVKWNGQEGTIKLADFGLAAYVETDLWNSRYKSHRWKVKKEKK